MSNKRKPLLSDEFLGALAPDPDWPDGPEWFPSATQVRNTYEGMIDSGKLRIANEVELISNDYDCLLKCSGCGGFTPYHFLEEFKECNYCPSCGGKIKKP